MLKGHVNSVLKFLTFYFILISLKTSSTLYEPTWDSLDQRPLPGWFDDAKVGLLIHWGPHSVPSYADEWFFKDWIYFERTEYVEFMEKNYGPHFTYQDIESEFTAELFDAKEWAHLFNDCGAKYVILTSKHHDGYTLWPSTYSPEWNSMVRRPKRDLVGEFRDGIKAQTSLRFGFQYILEETLNPMYLSEKLDKTDSTDTFVTTKIHPEVKELVTVYQPDILWINGGFDPETYWKTKEFLVWLYNESPVKNHVVFSDRWSSDTFSKHGDFQTYGSQEKLKWENPVPVDKTTWSYRSKSKLNDYLSSKEIIHKLIKTVGCGGNFLLNIGPTRFGNFAPIYEERLKEMGKWLKKNGEAIYSSKNVFPNDTSENEEIWYTTEKIASTENRIIVYAIFLNYPHETKTIDLHHLADSTDDETTISIVGLPNIQLTWIDENDVLRVTIPEKAVLDKNGLHYAWTLKITLPEYYPAKIDLRSLS